MCVVSMIMDHYGDKWGQRMPNTDPWAQPYVWPMIPPPTPQKDIHPQDIAEVLGKLKPKAPAITDEEIAEFRRLLERAREYDKRMGEPDCELDEKRQAILGIAKQLGVEIGFL